MAKGRALVTGASSGIGAELARLAAADGYHPVLVARNKPALTALASQLSRAYAVDAAVFPADLSDSQAPRAIFEKFPSMDILINNAGFGLRGPYSETDWQAEARMIQVNVTALAHLTKLYLPGMLERRSGRILNVGSTAGFVPGPLMAVYYATKAFVFSFSEAIANEAQGTGVTVTLLCPGPTLTNFHETAGIGNTNLFRGPSMSAAEVAREGYQAMMAGKPEIIAGSRNRWMIWSTRFAPRAMLARITRRLNSNA
jgi:short-subunit dehydrogenase